MSDAPERIWANVELSDENDKPLMGEWNSCDVGADDDTVYIRLDLHEAELAALREAAEDLATAYMAGRYDGRVAVRVKPVVWEKVVYRRSDEDPTEEWDGEFEAAPLGLCYEITMAFGTDSYVWDVRGPDFNDLGAFDSLEAAKAAAQADYEARILAAVEAVDLRPIREALECINRVLHFDLRRMIEFGDDYNQAVKDAADAATAALRATKEPTE